MHAFVFLLSSFVSAQVLAAEALLLGSPHSALSSAQQEPTLVFPETVAGRLAKAYLDAFNSGDVEVMRAFELSHRSESALKSRPMPERLEQYLKFYEDLGKLELQNVEAEQEAGITVEVTAAKVGIGLRMAFELEKATGKLVLIRITPGMRAVELPSTSSDPSVKVTSLAVSLEPLRSRFNQDKDKPRFIALLSPT